VDEMTPGEIGRSLKRLEDSQAFQTETLAEIKIQTTRTNGRVTAVERDVRDLKHERRVEHHESKRATDRPDVITLSIPVGAINARTVTASVAAIIAGLVAAWKAGLFG
jgi:hypothetical protein